MKGVCVLIVLCAVAAMILCSPALAGEKQKNTQVAPAAQKAAVQKSEATPSAVKGARTCEGGVCPVLSAVAATAKNTVRSVAVVRHRFARLGVRLIRPLRGGECSTK